MLTHLYFISTLICLFCLYSSISWLREPVVTLSDLLFFLGQCVYVLSSCCDIVPLALLLQFLKTTREEKKKNVFAYCAQDNRECYFYFSWRIFRMVKVMFLLEGSTFIEDVVFTHNFFFLCLLSASAFRGMYCMPLGH